MQCEEDDQAEADISVGTGNQVPEDPDSEENWNLSVNSFHIADAVYKMQPSKSMDNIIYPSIEDSFFLAYYSEVFDNCYYEPKKCGSDVLRSTDPLDDNVMLFFPQEFGRRPGNVATM